MSGRLWLLCSEKIEEGKPIYPSSEGDGLGVNGHRNRPDSIGCALSESYEVKFKIKGEEKERTLWLTYAEVQKNTIVTFNASILCILQQHQLLRKIIMLRLLQFIIYLLRGHSFIAWHSGWLIA